MKRDLVVKRIIGLLFLLFSAMISADEAKLISNGTIEKMQGAFIGVRIPKGNYEIIKTAPVWYLTQNNIVINVGDKIQIKYVELNGMKYATEIRKDEIVYKFIDEKGDFIWERKGIMGENRYGQPKQHNRKGMMQ